MTEHSPRRQPSYEVQRLCAERNRLARMYAVQRDRLERINAEYHRFEQMCETQRAREEAGWGDPPEIPPDSGSELDEPLGLYAFRACVAHRSRRPPGGGNAVIAGWQDTSDAAGNAERSDVDDSKQKSNKMTISGD